MIPLWDYRYRLLAFIWLLVIILALAAIVIFAEESQQNYYGHYQLFYEQPKVVYYPISGYEKIINCLIKYESSGNSEAIGDNGTSFGILQFKKSTFKNYCVEQFGYRDDIWNQEIQKECAAEMLDDNWNNIFHWTTAKNCL